MPDFQKFLEIYEKANPYKNAIKDAYIAYDYLRTTDALDGTKKKIYLDELTSTLEEFARGLSILEKSKNALVKVVDKIDETH